MPYTISGNGVEYYQFNNLMNHERLIHCVSTRNGGVSRHPYFSLNLGFRGGDSFDSVVENRNRLFKACGIDSSQVIVGRQIHAAEVQIVNASLRGSGALEPTTAIQDTDALITNERRICLMVLCADCVPIFLFDPDVGVVALAHAGWRGTVKRVVMATVSKMIERFGSRPGNIIAGIGPSIGPDDYQVGQEVISEIEQEFPRSWSERVIWREQDAFRLNLWELNILQLLECGVNESNIELSNISTFQLAHKFFSERRDGKPTGRFAGCIMLS